MKKYSSKTVTLILLLIVFMFAIIACDDTITNEEIDNRTIPSSNVDYYEHIQPVLSIKCATSFCHDDGSRAGGLSLTNYQNTTSDITIVFPGDPDLSKLVWAIEGSGGTQPMPPAGAAPPLTENQIKGIRTWIAEGARPAAKNP